MLGEDELVARGQWRFGDAPTICVHENNDQMGILGVCLGIRVGSTYVFTS